MLPVFSNVTIHHGVYHINYSKIEDLEDIRFIWENTVNISIVYMLT